MDKQYTKRTPEEYVSTRDPYAISPLSGMRNRTPPQEYTSTRWTDPHRYEAYHERMRIKFQSSEQKVIET